MHIPCNTTLSFHWFLGPQPLKIEKLGTPSLPPSTSGQLTSHLDSEQGTARNDYIIIRGWG